MYPVKYHHLKELFDEGMTRQESFYKHVAGQTQQTVTPVKMALGKVNAVKLVYFRTGNPFSRYVGNCLGKYSYGANEFVLKFLDHSRRTRESAEKRGVRSCPDL